MVVLRAMWEKISQSGGRDGREAGLGQRQEEIVGCVQSEVSESLDQLGVHLDHRTDVFHRQTARTGTRIRHDHVSDGRTDQGKQKRLLVQSGPLECTWPMIAQGLNSSEESIPAVELHHTTSSASVITPNPHII